ncbi:MAG TPA: DUF2064 domain-containing protein [Thermoanaerobaculia bacterium]|nr:DUF2064 domain-containing protein [Thermoanaerobaculia bacterium]
MKPGTPTLLIFTLGPEMESARRGLLPGELRDVETEVWQSCLSAALEAGRAAGCELEVCSPAPLELPGDARHVPQVGDGFGSRLEKAMTRSFSGALLVVGTDVPGLTERHLFEALGLLTEDPDRVVLGPSPDGGLYLLAASRPIEGLASATRWCRRHTLRGLLHALRASGRPVVLLEPLADLDRRADLETWVGEGDPRWRRLIRLLRGLLSDLRRPFTPQAIGRALPALVPVRAGRAPPRSPHS